MINDDDKLRANYRQILATGRLELDQAKIRNSEDQLIVATLENSWNMLSRSRGRILANAATTTRTDTGAGTDELPPALEVSQVALSVKEQDWLDEIELARVRLIEQADQSGLLKSSGSK